ncbi:MAG TPA: DUF2892 domain-containing protein [Nitrospiraceae bacterium]|nr:DUF2892 domain-containing protein [Nitrospiraceae bacterium]
MMERILRGMAGFMVLVSLALAQVHSPKWLILTVFMGLNLLQSAFTNWCPMMPILRAMGIDKKVDSK